MWVPISYKDFAPTELVPTELAPTGTNIIGRLS